MSASAPAEIIAFWREAGPAKWYAKDADFDAAIRERFSALHLAAARGELSAWEGDWQGVLALLILFDQFPRNIFRGSAHSFATDPLALSLSEKAIAAGFDQKCPEDLRVFFYMALEHSEALVDQDRCVALCEANGRNGHGCTATSLRGSGGFRIAMLPWAARQPTKSRNFSIRVDSPAE